MLKTSSGKIRRTATAAALQVGALDPFIVRRSGAAIRLSPSPPSTSEPASIAEFKLRQQQHHLWRPDAPTPSTPLPHLPLPPGTGPNPARPPLSLPAVKRQIAGILAEELKLDTEAVLSLSESFTFDEERALDEYGLDSLSAMRVAGRLAAEFDLLVPLSPFMFLADPTLNGMCHVVMRLYDTQPAATSAAEREKDLGGLVGDNTGRVGGVEAGREPALPCILGIGCVVPGPGAPQLAIMEVMIEQMQLPAVKAALFRKIGQTSAPPTLPPSAKLACNQPSDTSPLSLSAAAPSTGATPCYRRWTPSTSTAGGWATTSASRRETPSSRPRRPSWQWRRDDGPSRTGAATRRSSPTSSPSRVRASWCPASSSPSAPPLSPPRKSFGLCALLTSSSAFCR